MLLGDLATTSRDEVPVVAQTRIGLPPGLAWRRARLSDGPAIRRMHRASFAVLGAAHYTAEEIEGFFARFDTAEADIIADGTYALINAGRTIAASGCWTLRRPSYAGTDEPVPDARVATLRAVFTHPDFAGRGLARRMMQHLEVEAKQLGGAERLELCATRTGRPVYERLGYRAVGERRVELPNGVVFHGIDMVKLPRT